MKAAQECYIVLYMCSDLIGVGDGKGLSGTGYTFLPAGVMQRPACLRMVNQVVGLGGREWLSNTNRIGQMLPVVHHPLYSAPRLQPGHRFPMGVFEKIFTTLLGKGLISDAQTYQPESIASKELVQLVHCKDYVARFLNGELDPERLRRIGFGPVTNSQTLIDRTLAECSGTLLTAEMALKYGLAVNTAGGTHHAFPEYGSGFCILNDLAVTSEYLLAGGMVKRVLIVDLDVHQGDGTAAIFEDNSSVFTFSMHAAKNFPARKQKSNLDVALEDGTSDDAYMAILSHHLPRILNDFKPDIVLYDAGVDVHQEDALGRLALTDDGISRRDFAVLDTCLGHDIPVAGYVGGGYDACLDHLVKRHCYLHQAALQLWEAHGLH